MKVMKREQITCVTRSMVGGEIAGLQSTRAGNIRRSFRWPRRCAG